MRNTLCLLLLATAATAALATNCGYGNCPVPPKDGMINVHLVAHTHLDAGWLKTVDEYYYGARRDISFGAVQYTYDSVIDELVKNSDRRFIMVETAYFWRWWRQQDDIQRGTVERLVNSGQLEFTGGGWVQHDEATTYYRDMVDNMEYGFRILNDSFGACAVPKVGWQIDPFGHSKENAALMAQMGFDGLFFGRADYQDVAQRRAQRTSGMVWRASDQLGDAASLYSEILPNGYSPPGGFCFDAYCNDDPIMDDDRMMGFNVDQKVNDFINVVNDYANRTDTNTVIFTMGNDFNDVSARWWFTNLDKLIKYTNARQATGSNIHLMYSTPACYVKALNSVPNKVWTTKDDDFFPYASEPHTYWTGYFTSRTALKNYVNRASSFLQVCKQVDMLARLGPLDQHDVDVLREAVALVQHHDGVSGTEKQQVALDYAQRLSVGVAECESIIDDGLQQLITGSDTAVGPTQLFCQLLNISQCAVTENSPNVAITVYNPLPRNVSQYVRIPVVNNGAYRVVAGKEAVPVPSQTVPISDVTKKIPGRNSSATQELVFKVDLPPVGYQVYFISKSPDVDTTTEIKPVPIGADQTLENQFVQIVVDGSSGNIKSMTDKQSGVTIPLQQSLGYYFGYNGENNKDDNSERASGAYIFRPNCSHASSQDLTACVNALTLANGVQLVTGPLVSEVRSSGDWASLAVRLYADSPEVELEWTVGPIPFADGMGKEVIVRFDTGLASNGKFLTDANGRQLLERVRNYRPTWNVNLTEPIAGNFYPAYSYVGLNDAKTSFNVLIDRPYAVSSLADGQLEVMVHRRLLHDDAKGVGEALNETGIDGNGLVARGCLHLSLVAMSQLAPVRLRAQQLYAPASLSFSPNLTPQQWMYNSSFTGLQQALPPQINLLTLQQWRASTVLVRLEHMFRSDEDPVLGKPAQVDLRNLLTNFTVLGAQELTLGANRPVSDLAQRFKWKTNADVVQQVAYTKRGPREYVSEEVKRVDRMVGDDLVVTINPMEIRTYQIELNDDTPTEF